MKIPVFDLQAEINLLRNEIIESFESVLDSGQFIMGENVKKFEQEAAEYLGVKHAIGVNSGTDALVIGLRAAGISEGDEVITTPFTFFATAEAISQVGAKPIFVDINRDTFNIDPEQVAKHITPRTKAIIPVHMFGHPAAMEQLQNIAKRYQLKIIEDVAQAFGAEYKGQKAGTIGDVGCFSFFPTKNLGAYGDGGLIVTDDDDLARIAKMLRVHGSEKKYYNELLGYNSRLDEVHAAILRIKLTRIEEWNTRRINIAAEYNALLGQLSGVRTPAVSQEVRHVFHQYTIAVQAGKREALQKHLKDKGIGTMIYYPVPVHKLPIYEHMDVSCPVAEQISSEVLSLPMWPFLEKDQIDYIATQVNQLFETLCH